MFSNTTIVLGVTGGIAAYKACYLTSMFKKMGAHVHVCMTKNALEFVSPLTFEVLSGNPVTMDTFDRQRPWEVEHISLAKKADIFVIAPATANIIAKLANGIADDMLSTTTLATKAPIVIAPAMNTNMLENEATKQNLQTLISRGFHVMDTDDGLLACGDIGGGRMKEPEDIAFYCENVLTKKDLSGKNILISAGPTRENIDAVRYITNYSSGKMGFAMARSSANRGANVTLVCGPTSLVTPLDVTRIDVTSAQDMEEMMLAHFNLADIVIMSAAVADYTPKTKQSNKMKKSGDMDLALIRTTDILKKLGENKKNQILIGFAAETDDIHQNTQEKLLKKNLDMIALNDLTEKGAGFGTDTNHIYLYKKDKKMLDLGLKPKAEIADMIFDQLTDL